MVTSDEALRPYFQATVESPFIDLHDGFDGFVQQCARSGSDLVKSIAQKTRKMSREIAPMRFEAHRQDRSALDRLFAWKAAQRERTGTFDVLSTPCMRNVATLSGTTGLPRTTRPAPILTRADQPAGNGSRCTRPRRADHDIGTGRRTLQTSLRQRRDATRVGIGRLPADATADQRALVRSAAAPDAESRTVARGGTSRCSPRCAVPR